MTKHLNDAQAAWTALKAQLLKDYPELEADDQALYDTLDGATDLTEAIEAVMRSAEDDVTLVSALEDRIDAMTQRTKRFYERIERKREAVARVMESCNIKKVTAPDFTVSLAAGRPHVVVTDEKNLPAWALTQPKPYPNKSAILDQLKAGEAVPGAELSNPQPHIVVRRS